MLNEEDNNEIGNFITANKVYPVNKDYIIQISGTIIGKNKYEGCSFYYVDIGNNKIVTPIYRNIYNKYFSWRDKNVVF